MMSIGMITYVDTYLLSRMSSGIFVAIYFEICLDYVATCVNVIGNDRACINDETLGIKNKQRKNMKKLKINTVAVIIANYDYGAKKKGDIISQHVSYNHAEKALKRTPNASFCGIKFASDIF
jgi:hypothetical protein